MTSVVRLSRFSKIAALSAVGGSAFLFRNEIRQYLQPNQDAKSTIKIETTALPIKPVHINELPSKVPFLIVGGGAASHSAMRAIRGHDPRARVLIITAEDRTPYMRPALSKELWYSDKASRKNLKFRWWNGKERSIFYEIDEFYIPLDQLEGRENGGVSIIKNMHLSRLDPDEKIAYLENGQTLKYDKCLLAPGVNPKSLPVLESASKEVREKVLYFRSADDFLKLNRIAETAKSIVVIGGGFLGSELACALSSQAKQESRDLTIYQVFPETGNLGKILPKHLSDYVTEKIKQEGANVIPNIEIKSVEMSTDNQVRVHLNDGSHLDVDHIVCAVGVETDVNLAKASNLEVDEKTGGYLVNSELEARTDVWIAGDASCFYDIKLGRRRVEHHDHAIHSGRHAGQNMVGLSKAYVHQSMFWSDIGSEISFEAVGIIDSDLQTVSIFTQPETEGSYEKGLVFYLRNDIIVGVLLWNTFNRLNMARRIIHEQKKYEDFNEVAKLFTLYSEE